MKRWRDPPAALRRSLALLALIAASGCEASEVPVGRFDTEPDTLVCDYPSPAPAPDQRGPAALLACAAVSSAESIDPSELATLADQLGDPDWLARIDDADRYAGTFDQLYLGAVLDALAANSAAPAREVLLGLCRSAGFRQDVLRVQLLVHTLGRIRPLPEAAARWLGAQLSPASHINLDVIAALLENQSPSAMAALSNALLDPRFDREARRGWLREALIQHRDQPAVLSMAAGLVAAPGADTLAVDLVEVLFDYQPDWYTISDLPAPPAPEALSGDAADTLAGIGRQALAGLPLPDALAGRVRAVLRELDRR